MIWEWWDLLIMLYYKFTAEFGLERIYKISRCLAKLSVRKLISSSTMFVGHCPAERWKTRLRSDIWRAVTVITASRYDNSLPSITLTPWKTSIKLVFSRPFVTRRLMPSVTERWPCAQAFFNDVFLCGCCSCVEFVILRVFQHDHCKYLFFS